MSWSKIKDIIILILLAVNLCLSVFTMNRQTQMDQLQRQPRSEAIAFLKSRDIQIEDHTVPERMTLKPMQVTRNVQQEEELAAVLLGGTVSSDIRGGGVYRYFNDQGSVQFHSNGEFSARFSHGVYQAQQDSIQDHSTYILKQMEFSGELIRTEKLGEDTVLIYRQFWENTPLFNCQVQMNYIGNTLVAMTGGRRLTGVPEEIVSGKPISVATALMRFYNGVKELGDACTRIGEIRQGYILSSAIAEPVPMTPVWQVVTDTCTYQLDTLTGQLSRIP